jgi:superfamily II DNA helicase RecQ
MKWKVIRTGSSRKELKYQVVTVKSDKDMDAAIVQDVHKAILSYRPEDRAIVFCRSRSDVSTLAGLFKTHPYYAPGDNETLLEKNKEAMVKWISGDSKVMTSTSILGCGIDYAHIRDVVHWDPSYSMLDHYQEDSRGGRDGLECRATTFIVQSKKYQVPCDQVYDLGSQALYNSMYETNRCRRMASSLYLDGQAIQCVMLPGASFCDVCEEAAKEIIPALPRPSVPSTFSPPKRSFDLFDASPRINLHDHLRNLKRKRSSLDSNHSTVTVDSSSSKRVHFSDTPLLPRYLFLLLGVAVLF